MGTETINIIEPTLSSQAGHCYSFVNALLMANTHNALLRLWINRRAEINFDNEHVEVYRHFHRWLRRPQAYWLYRKLLDEPGKLFLSTATYTDLRLFDLSARARVPPHKAYFYVHWFNPNASKMQHLRRIAQRQPNLVIFGSTPTVVDMFREAGFAGVKVIPYPISTRPQQADIRSFRHLLFAGAARHDKGFRQVVDLVELLYLQQASIPITVQMSAEHFGKYDAETLADIQRLQSIRYPHLILLTKTLGVDEYQALFPGAITLQLYNVNDFSDRISGVTLDAFSGGSPVLTTAGTWIARMVQRFDAGEVVQDTTPSSLLVRIENVIAEYKRYASQLAEAGRILQQENSASTLYDELTS